MSQTLEKLKIIEKNGYQIDFGDVFNSAFENYKKIALYAGSVLVIFSILFIILTAFSLTSILDLTEVADEISSEKLKLKIETFFQVNLLEIKIISIFISSLLSPFFASFLKMADHGEKDKSFPASSLFSYYKLPYLKEIIFSTFLISAISFAQITLFTYIKFDFVGVIINYFISFITLLTVPLIIFGNLKALEAIKHSIQIVLKQPFLLFALILIAIIGSAIGIMACCFGIFFTMPFLYSMNYAIYSAIIGIDNPIEDEY